MTRRARVLVVAAALSFTVPLSAEAAAYITSSECTSGRTYYHTTGWDKPYTGSDGYPRVDIRGVEIRVSGGAKRTDWRIQVQTKASVKADWVVYRDFHGTDADGTVYINPANPVLTEGTRVVYWTSVDGDGLGACVRTHYRP